MDALKRGSAVFLEASQAMHDQIEEWERREAHWLALETRIRENLAAASTLITLDVGGTLFKTAKATLLRVEGSYFHAMLGSGLWTPDAVTNAYFLDLDATHFNRVMGFLRSGELSFAGLNEWECRELGAVFDYLKLPIPSEATWSWSPHRCARTLTLSQTNKTVATTTKSTDYVAVMGDHIVSVFRLRLVATSAGWLFVGLAPPADVRLCSRTYDCGGYCLQVNDGTLTCDEKKHAPYTTAFTAGDLVTVRWSDGKINFERNDVDLGDAFEVDPTLELVPVVVFYHTTATLSILQ
ncbi:Aste57867_5885 [Aphanomyces stellatus]|uniref:Aste57867_5885 protein n=1 Tax=Aphanomyces stellatus TaxID=120398 RepID=A0A485KGY8_9STRA|nr:hypothetical protein As57867_005871 [Aphanomyces stellatus]VFT82906.1 Aste57867_5885 [Aphanomyces stellatus]